MTQAIREILLRAEEEELADFELADWVRGLNDRKTEDAADIRSVIEHGWTVKSSDVCVIPSTDADGTYISLAILQKYMTEILQILKENHGPSLAQRMIARALPNIHSNTHSVPKPSLHLALEIVRYLEIAFQKGKMSRDTEAHRSCRSTN